MTQRFSPYDDLTVLENLDFIEERKFWKQYMTAYEKCLGATSTSDAPGYVVPADDKENARLIVSQIVLEPKAPAGIAVDSQAAREVRS